MLDIYLLAVKMLASPEERCLMEVARELTSKFCCSNWTWICYAWFNILHLLERNRRRPASRLLKPMKILDKIMNVWSCLFGDMKQSYWKLQRNVS